MNPKLPDEATALRMICFKTVISLARNVEGLPFSCHNAPDRSKCLAFVERWSSTLQTFFGFEDLTQDPTLMQQGYQRYDLASPQERTPAYRLLRTTCTIRQKPCVVWCELMHNNHFTFSTVTSGCDFEERVTLLEVLADEIAQRIKFAYSTQWGYLTAEPTRIGSGLQICSWTSLLGLTLLDRMHQTINAAEVKGVVAEKAILYDSPSAEFYAFFNRFSINLPPRQIIKDFKHFLYRLAKQEIHARQQLAYDHAPIFYDILKRTQVICQNGMLHSVPEATHRLSVYWTACSVNVFSPLPERYSFATCFDDLTDACFQTSLPQQIDEDETRCLPNAFQKMLNEKHEDLLRALWLRPLGKVTFTDDFMKRIMQ